MTSEELLEKLLANRDQCPFCGHDALDLVGEDFDLEISEDIMCRKCKKTWMEVYTLTSVEEFTKV